MMRLLRGSNDNLSQSLLGRDFWYSLLPAVGCPDTHPSQRDVQSMKGASLRKFGKGGSQPLRSDSTSRPPRQPIPGPTTPAHFFGLLIFSLLKKPMFVNSSVKAGIYVCAAAAGSLIFDFVKMPPCFFSNRRNVFNLVFVKWGWAWTFCSLSLFVILSTYVYTGGNKRLIRAHMMRMLAGSACWYVCTGLFNTVEASFGRCYDQNGALLKAQTGGPPFSRRSCRQSKGHWMGFDISGHCFLLVMCNLWIIEELRVMRSWPVLAGLLGVNSHMDSQDDDMGYFPSSSTSASDSSTPSGLPNVSVGDLQVMRSAYIRLSRNLRVIFSFTACLSLLWDFMIFVTIVYFHTMPTKLLGTAFGITCWFLCYRVAFPLMEAGAACGLAPGLPGDGPLHFMSYR
ncbi:fat storage-inducing transmembrane protein 2 [Sparganum proliferum]